MSPKHIDPTDQLYTCPMHPEIRQKHPGRCPLCGMRLEELGRRKQSRT